MAAGAANHRTYAGHYAAGAVLVRSDLNQAADFIGEGKRGVKLTRTSTIRVSDVVVSAEDTGGEDLLEELLAPTKVMNRGEQGTHVILTQLHGHHHCSLRAFDVIHILTGHFLNKCGLIHNLILHNVVAYGFKYKLLHFLKPLFRQRSLSQKSPSIFFGRILVILFSLQDHMSTYLPNSRINLSFEYLSTHFTQSLFLCITLSHKFKQMQALDTTLDKSSRVFPPSKTKPLTGYSRMYEILTPPLVVIISFKGALSTGKDKAK
ncbi:Glutamine-dependent NAD(+) synthetase [Striga asiatica]|uniref:Glutamine-dependent NAD(+) synthetase n=1 Tax=Striga asiatica TaxID=4170 RepID=A0A5A7PJS1_STRAF|nr:Glutamine-dependent NAD(+) synthetase [Striga asiatica]